MFEATLPPLLLTLKVATLGTLFALLAGVGMARAMSRRAFPGRDWLDAAGTLPLVLPPTVLGYYLIVLLGRRGVLAGTMLTFARAMGEFGATLMIAGNLPGKTQTLSLAVYSAVQAGNDGQANFMVIVISVVCVVILAATSKLVQPKT